MVANANAGVLVLNDWQFNATGIDGIGSNGAVSPISFMVVNNDFHTVIDTGGDAILNTGDTFNVQANGTVENFKDASSSIISPLGFNFNGATGWELTFTFNIDGKFSSDPTGPNLNTNFDHTNGVLNFYVDNLTDGGQASTANGTGVTDGVLVASFNVVNDIGDPNYGGVFSAALGNGGDKSLFSLASNPYGAFKDSLGNALAVGSTLAFSNTDFQSNVAGSGPFGYDINAFECGGQLTDFCGTESGQFRVGTETVPEPASLAILSIGIISLGVFQRRRSSI
jgi:hypothetical protein